MDVEDDSNSFTKTNPLKRESEQVGSTPFATQTDTSLAQTRNLTLRHPSEPVQYSMMSEMEVEDDTNGLDGVHQVQGVVVRLSEKEKEGYVSVRGSEESQKEVAEEDQEMMVPDTEKSLEGNSEKKLEEEEEEKEDEDEDAEGDGGEEEEGDEGDEDEDEDENDEETDETEEEEETDETEEEEDAEEETEGWETDSEAGDDVQATAEEWKQRYLAMKVSKKRLERRLHDCMDWNERLELELEDKSGRLDVLRNKLYMKRLEMELVEKKNEMLGTENEGLKVENHKVKAEKKRLEERADRSEGKYEALMQARAYQVAEILVREIEGSKAKLIIVSEEKKIPQHEYDELRSMMRIVGKEEGWEKDLVALEYKSNRLAVDAKAAWRKCEGLEDISTNLEKSNEKMKKRIRDLIGRLGDVEKENQALHRMGLKLVSQHYSRPCSTWGMFLAYDIPSA